MNSSDFTQRFNENLDKGRLRRIFQLGLFVFVFSLFSALVVCVLFPTSEFLQTWAWCAFAVILIFLNAFYVGVKYVKDIYEISDFRNALTYLLVVFFGYKLPKAKVSGGKRKIFGKFDFLELIGGPGVVQIERDNVVVVETLRRYKDVLVAGERNLSRYEFIKDILSTEEQYERIDTLEALTADGINVEVKNIQFRFRIDGFFLPNAKGQQTFAYLPLKLAVKDLAYHRPVPEEGKLAFWTTAVKGAVTGIIRTHINDAYLDDLIAPRDDNLGHSLNHLRQNFESEQIKERFKKMGIRFDACDIGEISVPAMDVDTEHLRMWFVRQSGAMNVIRAQSDSESFASQERGRAEGQALLLRGIARALDEIGVDAKDPAAVRKNLKNILLTRTAQILEARASIYTTYDEEYKHEHKEKL
jgi:hypothetical protein